MRITLVKKIFLFMILILLTSCGVNKKEVDTLISNADSEKIIKLFTEYYFENDSTKILIVDHAIKQTAQSKLHKVFPYLEKNILTTLCWDIVL